MFEPRTVWKKEPKEIKENTGFLDNFVLVIKFHSKKYEDFRALVTAANQREPIWAG